MNKVRPHQSPRPQHKAFIGDNIHYLKNMVDDSACVDVIYIDPPYNTGSSFSYNDKRKSVDWLNFMEQRLVLAEQILTPDGVLFISIDDSSLYELKVLCDEIFGKSNFLGNFITKQAIRSNSKHINTVHEYVLAYAKDKSKTHPFKMKRIDMPGEGPALEAIAKSVRREFKHSGTAAAEKLLAQLAAAYMKKTHTTWIRNYSKVDAHGEIFFPKDLSVPGAPSDLYIEALNITLKALPTRKWSSEQKIVRLHTQDRLYFKGARPYEKHYLKDSEDNVQSILDYYSRQGTNDLNKLGLRGLFDTPKPVALIKYLIRLGMGSKTEGVVLDFFGGSGTTGQAVLEVNREDGRQFAFHLVQLKEVVSEDSAQYQFAVNAGLSPTIDQLMLHRLGVVVDKLGAGARFSITDMGDE